jgi:glycosyltransferase involved in cell wall biosynthesis
MTDDLARAEERLRAVLTTRAADIPAKDLYAGVVRRARRFRLVVDWHEVWTREYWREYLGALGGGIGWTVQRACLRLPQRAFCFSRLHERRLREAGVRDVTLLAGQYSGHVEREPPLPAEPVVVFAGRLIPEKRAIALVPALRQARRQLPELRLEIYGDGPERESVLQLIAAEGLEEWLAAPGFVDRDRLDGALRRALCLMLPSRREGYGLVVVEAAARGVPSVVVREPDNAAAELVEDGVNGFAAPSADPEALAHAIVRIHTSGAALRASTAAWFSRNEARLSLSSSLERVLEAYAEPRARS